MKLLVNDPDMIKRIIRRRRLTGAARYDEVWDGVHVVLPFPNPEHMLLLGQLTHVLISASDGGRLFTVSPGGNISDRREGWTKNYRSPDLFAFLPGNTAEVCETHWFGGPDFAVEIVTRGDRSRKKFDFYAKVGVRELLLIERKPWRLELYRLADGVLEPAGMCSISRPGTIQSRVLDLSWSLIPGTRRPLIEIARPSDGHSWLA